MLSVLYAKHSSVAFVFKGLHSPFQISRQRPALTSTEEHRQDKWPIEYNLRGKTDRFVFYTVLPDLSWLSMLAPVWNFTCFTDVIIITQLVTQNRSIAQNDKSQEYVLVHFFNSPFICMLVDALGLMLLMKIWLLSELISMRYSAAVFAVFELFEQFLAIH